MDLSDILKKAAPWLAAAAAGPAGLAGMAIKTAAEALGATETTTEAVTAALVGANPEQMAALRQADNDFKLRMQELGYKSTADLEALAVSDRKDARDREVRLGDSWTPRILAAVVVGGFLSMVYMVLSGYVPGLKDPNIAGMVGTLIGYVSAKADQVVNYYFGSTASSARKTDLLAKAPPIER